MKKFLAFLGTLLFVSSVSFAQTTAVSATVTDTDGTLWTNGTVTVQFMPNLSNSQISNYHICGTTTALNPTYLSQGPLSLGSGGNFSTTTYDNNQICPTGSSYQFTICPQATSKCGVINTITTGVSESFTSLFSNTVPTPRFPAVLGNYGYADVEATVQLTPGSFYYNVVSSCLRTYSGSAWSCSAGGAPINSPVFTGTPTAPTNPNPYDYTTQLATDQFVTRLTNLQMAITPITVTGGSYSFNSACAGTEANLTASGGAINSILVWIPVGSGCQVNDVITFNAGNYDALIRITTVNGSGQPTAGTILYGGTGYTSGTAIAGNGANAVQYAFDVNGAQTGASTFIMPFGSYLTTGNQWYWANNTTGGFNINVCQAGAVGVQTCTGNTVSVTPGVSNNSNFVAVNTDGTGTLGGAYQVGCPLGGCVLTGPSGMASLGIATSGTNYSSNNFGWAGSYWSGLSQAPDVWTWQDVIGVGANPTVTFTLNHINGTGSPAPSVSIPYPISTGPVSAPSISVGTPLPSNAPAGTLIASCSTSLTGPANVQCYGADPSGVADSYPAFAAAAATATSVFIPPGHYTIKTHIAPNAGQEWYGSGERNSVVTYSPTSDPDVAPFDLAAVQRVHLHDFQIISPSSGIRLSATATSNCSSNSDYNKIERMAVYHLGGLPGSPGTDTGILLDGSTATNQMCIYYNKIMNNYINGFSNGITLGAGGSASQSDPTGANSNIVRDNQIEGFYNAYLIQSSENEISGGFLTAGGTGAIAYNAPAIAGQNIIFLAIGEPGVTTQAYLFGAGGSPGLGNTLFVPNGADYQVAGVDNSPTVNQRFYLVNGDGSLQAPYVNGGIIINGGATVNGNLTFNSNVMTMEAHSPAILMINYTSGGQSYWMTEDSDAITGSWSLYDSTTGIYDIFVFPNDHEAIGGTTDCGQRLCVNGGADATAFTSTVATGTAPLTVASTTPVANLAIIQTAHQISSPLKCADTSGSGTVQSCTTSPSFTPAANDCVIYTTTTANTSTALSLNVNSLGADSVAKWQGTTTLAAGDVPANKPVLACLDAANHWDLSTIGNVPGGTRAATQKNVTSSSGPANTGSFTMQGLAGTITPAVSGNILITISGTIYGSTLTAAGDGINFSIAYGTGTAPSNGAASTGTLPTNGVQYSNPTTVTSTDVHVPFSTSAVVSGLTLSTAYWVDLTAEAIGAAGFTLNNVSVSIIEN